VLFVILGYIANIRAPWTLLTLAFGGYAAQVTLGQMFLPMIQRIRRGESAASAFVDGNLRRGRRRFASYVVHAAIVVAFISIAVSSSMRQQTELHFTKGQTQKVSGFDVTFLGADQRTEPHRTSIIGRFAVARDGKEVATLEPRMNQYESMREPIGTPDVYTTAGGDFYLALSNIDPMRQTVSITVFAAPLVVWIWISVIVMGVGALFGLVPSRRVIPSTARDPLPVNAEAETA
jgi:cytochrome c biogenesis factor